MTTLDQKRMLKLAGLLKEGVEEWIDETAPDMEKVPHANVDADLDIPMGYAPGEDQSDDRKEDLYSLYSDMYKEINGFRPRWVRPEELSVEDLEMMVKDLQNDIDVSIEDQDWYDYRSKIADEDYEKETEIRELQPSAEEEEDQRLPKQMSMRKSGNRPRFPSLEETYIYNMKESLEEAIRSIIREVLAEKKAKTYKGKSMRLGGGGRFAKFVDSLKKSGKSEEQARAIAYKAGVNKYGKEKMKKMAAAGKKREAKKED